MKVARVFSIAMIASVLFSLFLTTATFGCIPTEDGKCAVTKPALQVPVASNPATAISVPAPQPLAVPQPAKAVSVKPAQKNQAVLKKDLLQFAKRPAVAPPAAPPADNTDTSIAVVPQDTWVYIGPHTTVWFRVGDELRRLSVSVDAGHQSGLEMSVYSPELGDVLNSDPTGRGTAIKGKDLYWSGAARGKGAWYVKLKNTLDFSIPYNLVTSTVTDSGVEYRPLVTYAFGTGDSANTVKVAASKPAAPPAPPVSQPAAAVVTHGADNPGAAQEPNGSMEYIAPGQSLWYKMFTRQRLYVWADTSGQPGIELAIFAPGTTDFWGTKPIGVGSKNKNEGHDLFWTGRAPGSGTWYARVTNKTNTSMPITVNFERVKSRLKDFCTSCHGDEFDFETCDSKDPAFCEEFLPSLLQQ